MDTLDFSRKVDPQRFGVYFDKKDISSTFFISDIEPELVSYLIKNGGNYSGV